MASASLWAMSPSSGKGIRSPFQNHPSRPPATQRGGAKPTSTHRRDRNAPSTPLALAAGLSSQGSSILRLPCEERHSRCESKCPRPPEAISSPREESLPNTEAGKKKKKERKIEQRKREKILVPVSTCIQLFLKSVLPCSYMNQQAPFAA